MRACVCVYVCSAMCVCASVCMRRRRILYLSRNKSSTYVAFHVISMFFFKHYLQCSVILPRLLTKTAKMLQQFAQTEKMKGHDLPAEQIWYVTKKLISRKILDLWQCRWVNYWLSYVDWAHRDFTLTGFTATDDNFSFLFIFFILKLYWFEQKLIIKNTNTIQSEWEHHRPMA